MNKTRPEAFSNDELVVVVWLVPDRNIERAIKDAQ